MTDQATVIVEVPVEITDYDPSRFCTDVAAQIDSGIGKVARDTLPGDDFHLIGQVTVHTSAQAFLAAHLERTASRADDGTRTQLWLDDTLIGVRSVTADGSVQYTYLQVSASAGGGPATTRLYTGRTGNPDLDALLWTSDPQPTPPAATSLAEPIATPV